MYDLWRLIFMALESLCNTCGCKFKWIDNDPYELLHKKCPNCGSKKITTIEKIEENGEL